MNDELVCKRCQGEIQEREQAEDGSKHGKVDDGGIAVEGFGNHVTNEAENDDRKDKLVYS